MKPATLGLRHLALYVEPLEACIKFYVDVIGMTLVWQPDADNAYLSSGSDNLALHRAKQPASKSQQLDHLGFMLPRKEDVDTWHAFMVQHKVPILRPVSDHRDGARSFYCQDPAGISVQIMYHPDILH